MFPFFEHFMDGKALYEKRILPVCQAFDLTSMEFTVLMFLHNYPQYDTAAQIVKVRQLTKSHVSVSVKALQKKGLVQGIYYPGNQKTLHLRLTEAANPIVEAGAQAQKEFGAMLVRGFSPEEVEQLQYLINRLHKNMKREETTNG